MSTSNTKRVIFSWYGSVINGVDYGRRKNNGAFGNSKTGTKEQLVAATENRRRYGNRKALRRAVRNARGRMDYKGLGELLARVRS